MSTLKSYNVDARIGWHSIQAVYAVNSYLKANLSEYNMNFYPGNSAPKDAGHNYILYSVLPITDVEFYMIHTDQITYNVVHTNYDQLSQIVYIINNILNVDDIEGLITEPGIRFQFSHSNPVHDDSDFFEDSEPYFYKILECMIMYQML